MGDAILHRGPDDSGSFADGELLLGMRRLAIIDVAGGHQPIASEDGQIVVVCNGEIYNFRELRKQLQAAGHRFATDSDSEVAVHAYEEYGDAFLERLDGMFGLARLGPSSTPFDRGPRCHRHQADLLPPGCVGAGVCFRSQGDPRAAGHFGAARRQNALAQYLSVGYVCAPNSIFEGMQKLEPGTALIVENGKVRKHAVLPAASSHRSHADRVAVGRGRSRRTRALGA